jgi:hypothetical protein
MSRSKIYFDYAVARNSRKNFNFYFWYKDKYYKNIEKEFIKIFISYFINKPPAT